MEEMYDNLPWPKLLGPGEFWTGHQEDLPDPSLLRSKSLFRRHAVDHVDRAMMTISKFHPVDDKLETLSLNLLILIMIHIDKNIISDLLICQPILFR